MTSVFIHHPEYHCELPPGHRFPMGKFKLLAERLTTLGICSPNDFHQPPIVTHDQLALVHERHYIDAFINGNIDAKAERKGGLPWSPALVHRSLIAVGGTIHTARLALQHGRACNTAGGTHHAFPDHASGYCLLNDLAVAAKVLLAEGVVQRLMIIDCDVHQGDGTAVCCADDDRITTVSFHCGVNFPATKQRSDVDVDMPKGCRDEAYLATMRRVLSELWPKYQPELVLYDAGVDPHVDDLLGHLALSDDGIRQRDRWIFQETARLGIPIAAVIGGGYDRNLPRLVERHSILHQVASEP